jgi:isopenicillin N synthase-like dioxygenase
MLQYYDALHALSLKVLEVLARGLPYGPNVFNEFISNDAVAVMRLLHYPPQTSTDEKQLGAGAHTDFGAITLLLQDDHSGLQVLNDATGDWINVVPNRDAYVVNIGDMLDMWTCGEYKSNMHRVLNQSSNDRYSVPFFFDGNLESKLAPLDGRKIEGEPLTVEEHMLERFASTYGQAKKT